MAILSLQRRLAEVGRIRLGQQIESKSGKKRPAALTTFRLTSPDRARIEEAAKLYGGAVTKWEAPNGILQWEVITQADKLPVVVPPSAMSFSQHYELWSAGGCQRRCDGVTETLSEQPCICNPESRTCEIHTRLSVMLRDLSGLGVWRVDTQGYYAAVELQGAVEVITLAAGRGQMLPATLRLDQRTIKRADEGTKRFVTPVLDVEVTPAQLLMGAVAVTPAAELEQQRALTPVPDNGARPASIADQVAASESLPSRRRATPIKGTGIAPRTAAQAGGVAPPARRPGPLDHLGPPPEPEPGKQVMVRVTENGPQYVQMTEEELAQEEYEAELAAAGMSAHGVTAAEDAGLAAAREAREQAESMQDQPRMCTKGQLTKLGVLLTNRGFDKTAEGRRGRLDFCVAAIVQLMPDSPYAGRPISSSKELTFDEADALINMLEAEENERQGVAGRGGGDDQGQGVQPSSGTQSEPDPGDKPVGEPVNDLVPEQVSAAQEPDAGAGSVGDDGDHTQMNLI